MNFTAMSMECVSNTYLCGWILLVFCKNVCVVVPGEQFLSELDPDVHFHQWRAWSATGIQLSLPEEKELNSG